MTDHDLPPWHFTPWGNTDQATECKPGIVFVSTASHGGFYLSPARRSELPAALRGTAFVDRNKPGWAPDTWWEEDCDAAKIAAHFNITATN